MACRYAQGQTKNAKRRVRRSSLAARLDLAERDADRMQSRGGPPHSPPPSPRGRPSRTAYLQAKEEPVSEETRRRRKRIHWVGKAQP